MVYQLQDLSEKRSCERRRESRSIEWRRNGNDFPRRGWLLESSTTGLAFAWRGSDIPKLNAVLDVCLFPDDRSDRSIPARVVRIKRAHEDLMVIGVERMRPFPPAAVLAVPRPVADEGDAEAVPPVPDEETLVITRTPKTDGALLRKAA